MADGGNMPVTERDSNTVPGQKLDGLKVSTDPGSQAVRPLLLSHVSSSLPSTPYVHARKLSDEYRTPSPSTKGNDVSSPRSARSESDSTVRPTARTPFLAGCKYETGMAFSRRRIPYSIGGDLLEPVAKVKKHLDPAQERKLSGDMRELYDRILPSPDSDRRRAKFVEKLEKILNKRWPGNSIKVHVFGSSGNLLCSNDSDVDICITTPMKALERVCLLAKALAEHGMERVVCVPHAKVPIVKMWDPELELACDMNVNNTLALENTRMIRTYVQIDPRVRPLAMVIKHWTRRRVLNDAALGGTLSSYTWICLIINFLQTRTPKILPSLQAKAQDCKEKSADHNHRHSSFNDDLESLRGFGDANKETLGELLFHFFRRYGHELDFEKYVISIREGDLISKTAKKWHLMQNNRLCVEEPFNTDRNLGNTADDTSFRGVHLELRRAFDLVSQAKLEECCEEYIFPPQEEKVWIKPQQQRRAVLTRSLSQQARSATKTNNGHGQNNRTGNNKSRSGTSYRRASSAAALNKMSPFPIGQSTGPGLGMGPGPGQGPVTERLSGSQIHDQLFHHYQLLQAQEAQLRLQMHQRAQATLHAQATAANMQPVQAPLSAYSQQHSGFENHRRQSAAAESGPLSAPLRSMQAMYYPMQMAHPQMQRMPQSIPTYQTSTNPPSPSLPVAQPVTNGELRRGMQRSATNDGTFAGMRSHSQPPSNGNMRVNGRPGRNVSMMPPNPDVQAQNLGFATLQQYQQAYLQAKHAAELASHPNMRPSNHLPTVPSGSPRLRTLLIENPEPGMSPRYMGYYVEHSPLPLLGDADGLLPPIPAYSDLASRTRQDSLSPNLTRLRSHTSRSPSPTRSSDSRGHSTGFYASTYEPGNSFPIGNRSDLPGPSPYADRPAVNGLPARPGPVIVDGSSEPSDYVATPESSLFFPTSQNGVHDRSINNALGLHADYSGSIVGLDGYTHLAAQPEPGRAAARTSPSILQFGDFPARATVRANRTPKAENPKTPERLAPQGANSAPREQLSASLDAALTASKHAEVVRGTVEGFQTPSATEAFEGEDNSAASAQVLSPVREVRTPSPRTTRSSNSIHRISQLASRMQIASNEGEALSASADHQRFSDGQRNVEKYKLDKSHTNGVLSNGTANSLEPVPHPLPTASFPSPPQQEDANNSSQKVSAFVPTEIQLQTPAGGWQQSLSKKVKRNQKSHSVGSAPLHVQDVDRKGG